MREDTGIRVENRGANVEAWSEQSGEGASTYDVCEDCAAYLDVDPHCFNRVLLPFQPGEPQGEDGWGGDVEHPPYSDGHHRCAVCRALLVDA